MNLTMVLIVIVVVLSAVLAVVSIFIPAWFRDSNTITRGHVGNFFVKEQEQTLEDYMKIKTDEWVKGILEENTEECWCLVLRGNGRTELEPDGDAVLEEFDAWCDGKYTEGEEISDEDILMFDAYTALHSDYVVTIEKFDFYEFTQDTCDAVYDIRSCGADREVIGSREWFEDLDYIAELWDEEIDGEMKLQAPAVVVWVK